VADHQELVLPRGTITWSMMSSMEAATGMAMSSLENSEKCTTGESGDDHDGSWHLHSFDSSRVG
jgi:hypothetical protein